MIGITNNDDDDGRIPNIKFPAVMACGYRRIEIPKSGNFFPAFLIALPIIQPVQVQAQIPAPLIKNINQDEQRQQQDKTIRFVWRSKRDFLILARSLSSSTNNRQLSLPKAALKKIVQGNIIPWRRTRTSCCSSSTKTKPTEDEEEENDNNSNSNNNNNIPYFLCDPKLPNKFCPQMKKSLWQLDQFLQMFYTETIATTTTSTDNCNSNNNTKAHAHAHAYTQEQQRQQQIDKMKLAWEIFCRPYDTEGLITPKEFFPSTTTTSNDTNTNTTTRQEQIQKQKQQVVDEQNSINITKTTKTTTTTTTTTATSLEESCKLGQYFASKENSKRVVDCALEKIIPLYHEYNNRHQQQQQSHNNDSNNSSSSSNNNNHIQILFIEPSCGHGDIVVALVDALKKRKTIIPPQSVYIQGYDIDPNAITTCRQRQEFVSPSATTTTSSSSDDDDDDYHIHWECRNFLETTRQQYIEKFDEAAAAINNNNNNDDDSNIFNTSNNDDNDNNNNKRFIADTCTDATRNNNRNININNDNNGDETLKFLVCCLGGPPYTTGPGHGSKIQRDLPTQFVRHCQEEWNADVITFILPTRYREGMQHNISDCTFTTARTKTKRTTTMTEDPAIKTAAVTTTSPSSPTTTTTATTFSRDCCTNNNWICDTKELNASTFFFRGSTQVTQPSIIQNFYINRGNERTKC